MSAFSLRYVPYDWPDLAQAVDLRYTVLQEPFGVERDDDWNDEDPRSRHLVAVARDGRVIGYARLIVNGDAQIRQVAVDPEWRGAGVGSALIRTLVRTAECDGFSEIWLNARVPAIGFYERLGFEAVGDVFNTGRTDIPHRRMEYRASGGERR